MITISIRIFTDSSANLPEEVIRQRNIGVVPLTLTVNGTEMPCYEPDGGFDGEAFYKRMRADDKLELKTSMINSAAFLSAFEPCLEAGDDVVYVAMSSGISGTYFAGETAAEALRAKYPERSVLTVDTLAASLGEGLMVLEAAELRDGGTSAAEIASYLEARRSQMRQHFMVDDLKYLKRGGRISTVAALAGTLLSLRPILTADAEGRIVLDKKIVGRKKALIALGEIFDDGFADAPENCRAGIAHGGCEADAQALANAICARHPGVGFTIVCYEPGTGAHVGPDTVALFFWGHGREEKAALLASIGAKIAAEAAHIKSEIGNKLHRD